MSLNKNTPRQHARIFLFILLECQKEEIIQNNNTIKIKLCFHVNPIIIEGDTKITR